MVVMPWPNPIPGQPDQVVVDDMPMQLVPGKYSVEEANRFGEKVSQGALKYADFNPFESTHAISSLAGGAGLRRYTDIATSGDEINKYITLYTESNNVNCAFSPIVLSPEVTFHELPGAVKPAVWMGEDWRSEDPAQGKRYLAVAETAAGTSLYERGSTGVWAEVVSIAGKFGPRSTAIGVYEGIVVIGFGHLHQAVCVLADDSVVNLKQAPSEPGTDTVPIYVWAYTSDHATNFIAGGPSTGDYFRVMSSVDPHQLYAEPVPCGDTLINSLAPGGGLTLVYVGKIDALGMIDDQAVYHDLIPFDSRLVTNCRPMRWLLASGADQQRGSLSLVFPRDRSLWEYVPADQFSGTASCIAPWAASFRRPPQARGLVTALVGSSRWLYYAVTNGAGDTWIWRNDQTTGAPHTYLFLGQVDVGSMGITHMFTGNPRLLFSVGVDIGEVILPLDGDAEYDDPACRYALEGYVDLPEIDLGFPDEDKIGFGVRIISDNLVGLNRYHKVEASLDGGDWIDLGDAIHSPSDELDFPLTESPKRIRLRVWFFTDDNTQSPQMWGLSLRVSLNTKVYRLYLFQTRLPSASFATLADDLQNPYLQILKTWAIRRRGTPVPFLDPWSDEYLVRVLKIQEQQALREPDRTPEWVIDWTLLEFKTGSARTGQFVYDMEWTASPETFPDDAALYGYDAPLAIYDTNEPRPTTFGDLRHASRSH